MISCTLCGEPFLETLAEIVNGQVLYCPACDTPHTLTWLNQAEALFTLTVGEDEEDEA